MNAKPTDEKKTPVPKTTREDAQRVVRRLQGEDGYDIFADRKGQADHARWLRDYEDNRR